MASYDPSYNMMRGGGGPNGSYHSHSAPSGGGGGYYHPPQRHQGGYHGYNPQNAHQQQHQLENNRSRTASGSSNSSNGSGKARKRSHRPRGCRGGSNRRRNNSGDKGGQSKNHHINTSQKPVTLYNKPANTGKKQATETPALIPLSSSSKSNSNNKAPSSSQKQMPPPSISSKNNSYTSISTMMKNEFPIIQPSYSDEYYAMNNSENAGDSGNHAASILPPPLPAPHTDHQYPIKPNYHGGVMNPYALHTTSASVGSNHHFVQAPPSSTIDPSILSLVVSSSSDSMSMHDDYSSYSSGGSHGTMQYQQQHSLFMTSPRSFLFGLPPATAMATSQQPPSQQLNGSYGFFGGSSNE